jgi:hypothetical protein
VTASSKRVAIAIALVLLGLVSPLARAGVWGRTAREAAEAALWLFGKRVEMEGAEVLARKIKRLAIEHGDAVLAAARKGGPEAVRLIERAGVHGEQAARVLARYGPEAARIVERPALMELVERHGEDAVRALLRHPGLAEPVVAALGKPGARALAAVNPRNARRLAMMVEDGSLRRIGRVEEVLGVVERYGDRALDFVWRHKGALTVGTLLTAFLRDPARFLGGTRDLATSADEAVRSTIAGAVGHSLQGLARPGLLLSAAAIAVLASRLAWCIQRRPARHRG